MKCVDNYRGDREAQFFFDSEVEQRSHRCNQDISRNLLLYYDNGHSSLHSLSLLDRIHRSPFKCMNEAGVSSVCMIILHCRSRMLWPSI